jgi:putative alpha-1,2-mannosidase
MHGSSYPKISIAVNDGKTFTIIAKNYSKDKLVKSVTLNGKKHSSVFLKYSEIMSGGELVFEYE